MKGKWQERKRRATSPRVLRRRGRVAAPVPPEPPKTPRVRRVPRYPVKPMTVDEAALGRGRRRTTRSWSSGTPRPTAINVLYRRKDGHLGLIEPEG